MTTDSLGHGVSNPAPPALPIVGMAVLTAVIVSMAAVRVSGSLWMWVCVVGPGLMRLIMSNRFAGVGMQMIMPRLRCTVGEGLCRSVGMWVVVVKGVSHGSTDLYWQVEIRPS